MLTMTAARLPIVQYWHSEPPPGYVAGLIESFKSGNPGLRHMLFDRSSAEAFIAERFGDREVNAFRACAVPSMQSDYLRYCSVLALGGVYADVDYRCKAPLAALIEGCEGGEIFRGRGIHDLNGRDTQRIWTGLFAFKQPGHPFLELALEIATANVEARIPERIWKMGENVREAIWLTVGPGVFTLMTFVRDWGSFDAFIEGIEGSVIEPFGKLYCETIGEHERLVEAFEGVRVSPHEEIWRWVEDVPPAELPYKETGAHWHNVETAIFR
jgi:hypothetical protein